MSNKFKETIHIPVLLKETVDALEVVKNGTYIDGTLGGGGHTLELAKKLLESKLKSQIIGIDQDENAILMFKERILKEGFKEISENKFKKAGLTIILKLNNFSNLEEILEEEGIEKVNGIMADLGMSTDQLEDLKRGFSFKSSDSLDLRMSSDLGVTDADLLNALYKKELMKVFTEYGDLREANRLADKIIELRKIRPFKTVKHLLEAIEKAVNYESSRKILEARVIQALRIAVNDELGSLQRFLPKALESLAPNGNLSIISFHSGEDRIVKRFFKEELSKGNGVEKMIYPTQMETIKNSKSTSAKLRVFTKTN